MIDIIGYPDKAVAEQAQMRARFHQILGSALTGVSPQARIVLDTADGAAVTFIEDPDDALRCAARVRDAVATAGTLALALRGGIHHGPVMLIGEPGMPPNLVGDGLGVAQRVAGFASVGRVFATRAFVEALANRQDACRHLFEPAGVRTDAQLREHEVFILTDSPLPERPDSEPHAGGESGARSMALLAGLLSRPPLVTVLTMGAILLVAMVIRAALPEQDSRAANDRHGGVVQAPVTAPQRTVSDRENGAPTDAERLGTLRVNVLPWGEVGVAGVHHGAAPPERHLMLAPGQHVLEIRNPAFAPHKQQVEVRAGEETRIRHDFRQ
ncbi:PEGA domain-containing protein [Methyloversatilis sp.]|uniref:PEGA domain-containing protein n=1 Tax=Methyloversatilis sp. TaxID=2569862 RepID=UPI00273373B0|nr:PEGA domain-containing protein [Methyloversatilis sp.]MDP2869306.1 PEGA domain-containing protein [Methyloversatilis sp.]MDP3456891.1 PEGA domain-containing protein [Methyloversatilis sp.]MDP3580099.1 PEGA domain-containing protein [Methyloversatilis sp.]